MGGGGALPTSCGTGDCIGLSQVISTYSRGRDLHGIFFLSWLLIEDLLTLLLSGVHKMKFKLPHKITDSQNTPIKSPNISCDSTVPDSGIPKGDSSKMVLDVQNTKQNYKTKALKMSKGSMPQMSLAKRRGKSGTIKKIQTSRRYKKKLKSQLDMTTQGSLKSKHNNNARLHNKTFNTKFMVHLETS